MTSEQTAVAWQVSGQGDELAFLKRQSSPEVIMRITPEERRVFFDHSIEIEWRVDDEKPWTTSRQSQAYPVRLTGKAAYVVIFDGLTPIHETAFFQVLQAKDRIVVRYKSGLQEPETMAFGIDGLSEAIIAVR